LILTLVRHAYLLNCTLGTLRVANLTLCTLEEPWIADPDGPGGQRREPGKRESCVPDGVYKLIPHNGTRHKNVWALENPTLGVWHHSVPDSATYGRAAILIHAGNTVADIEGCILVGLRHGRIEGTDAVLESRIALDQLRALLGPTSHHIHIRSTTGTAEVSHGR
jgi:hypothetical protein